MTNIMKISGLIHREISSSTIVAVQKAADRDHIGSVVERAFEAIKDFFCRTNMAEAKKCLFDLYANLNPPPDETSQAKAERMETIKRSYDQLKDLSGYAYKDRFRQSPENFGYSLNIDLGGNIEPYKCIFDICSRDHIDNDIKKSINDFEKACSANGSAGALLKGDFISKDINRADYYINDELVCGLTLCKEKGEEFKAQDFCSRVQEQLSCTDEQINAIKALAWQVLPLAVKASSSSDNGGLLSASDFFSMSGPKDDRPSLYKITKDMSNNIVVRFSDKVDSLSNAERDSYRISPRSCFINDVSDLSIEGLLSIDTDGRVLLLESRVL